MNEIDIYWEKMAAQLKEWKTKFEMLEDKSAKNRQDKGEFGEGNRQAAP